MLDIKLLAEQIETAKAALTKKKVKPETVDEVLELDLQRRKMLTEIEILRSEQNKVAKEIPAAATDQKTILLERSRDLKERLKNLEPQLTAVEQNLRNKMLTIPNIPFAEVLPGDSDDDNAVIEKFNTKPEFNFTVKDHFEILRNLDLVDTEAAAAMSGSRFYYLKKDAVRLEMALQNYVLNTIAKHGFTPVTTPMLVKERAMEATGFFPADKNEIYEVNPNDDKLYLIGTSEVPLCMLHADQLIPAEKLPLRYVGYSTCFRREAGSYGKDTAGILRVHQFNKMEMFVFCTPEQSRAEHELIFQIEKEIYLGLGLHFQSIDICGADLGVPAAKKYDLEVWMPAQNRYREITSCSNCTDYQARRANIRVKQANQNNYLHTLNGTGFTIRSLIAIVENFQQEDGSVRIPEVLRPLMGNQEFIGK